MTKSSVTHAPFDEYGNLMHWAREGSGYGQAHEWRPNMPFEADLRIAGMESGRSAKYVVLTDGDGHRFSMFVTDLLDALRTPDGVREGRFGCRRWVVAKRGQNFGVKVAPAEVTA